MLLYVFTEWDRDNMDAILLTTFQMHFIKMETLLLSNKISFKYIP